MPLSASTRCSACSLAPSMSGSRWVKHACCCAPCRRVAPPRAPRLHPRPPQHASRYLLPRRRPMPHHRRLARRRLRQPACLRKRAPPCYAPVTPHHSHHAPSHHGSPSSGHCRFPATTALLSSRATALSSCARPPRRIRLAGQLQFAPVAATGPYARGSRATSTRSCRRPRLARSCRCRVSSPKRLLVAAGLLVHEHSLHSACAA